MKRHHWIAMGAFAIALSAAACNTAVDTDGSEAIQEQPSFDKPDNHEHAELPPEEQNMQLVEVADGIHRQITARSVEPTVEFTSPTGSAISIWVHDDGSSSVFEGIPANGTSALQHAKADSPLELFIELAPEGLEAPLDLSRGRRFSVLEEETAAMLAKLPPEDLVIDAPQQIEEDEVGMQAKAVTSCSKTMANNFNWNYRPGIYSGSEAVTATTSLGYNVPEARRRKDYQINQQMNGDHLTPSLQTNYIRATLSMCSGTARITLWRCAAGACDDGTHAAEFGPFTVGAGGTGIYKDWPGGDYGRARLDQMGGASDHALWAVIGSLSAYSEINGCYH